MNKEKYEIVDSVEKLGEALNRVRAAQKEFSTFTQEQVDKIFLAAASASFIFARVRPPSKALNLTTTPASTEFESLGNCAPVGSLK
jgi:hypothetical protein